MTMSTSSAELERKTIFAKRSELFLFACGETVIFLCFPIAPTAPTWEGNYPTLRPRHRFRFSWLVVFLSIDTIVNKNGLRLDPELRDRRCSSSGPGMAIDAPIFFGPLQKRM